MIFVAMEHTGGGEMPNSTDYIEAKEVSDLIAVTSS
jgi:hypothetical protein